MKVFEFITHEENVEKLPDLPHPLPSDRLSDCMPQWFASFVDLPQLDDVYDLLAAANYLDVPSLVELGCAKVGAMMKNKSITELR